MKKVLLESISSPRDAVHLLKVIEVLKQHDPNIQCYCMVLPEVGELLESFPNVEHVLLCPVRMTLRTRRIKQREIQALNCDTYISVSGQRFCLKMAKRCGIKNRYALLNKKEDKALVTHYAWRDKREHINQQLNYLLSPLKLKKIYGPTKKYWEKVAGSSDRINYKSQTDPEKQILFIQTRGLEKDPYPTAVIETLIKRCLETENFFVILAGIQANNPLVHFKDPNCLNLIGTLTGIELLEGILFSDYYVGPYNAVTQIAQLLNKPLVSFVLDPQFSGRFEMGKADYQEILDWRDQSCLLPEHFSPCTQQLQTALSTLLYNHSLNLKPSESEKSTTRFLFDTEVISFSPQNETLSMKHKALFDQKLKQTKVISPWSIRDSKYFISALSENKLTVIHGHCPPFIKACYKLSRLFNQKKECLWIPFQYSSLVSDEEWVSTYKKALVK